MAELDVFERSGPEADRRRVKFENWLSRLPEWHDQFVFTACPRLEWTPLLMPLAQTRVALVSTGGVHLRSQAPFDTHNPDGDSSYRIIPAQAAPQDFCISDTHYDHSDGDADINCIFGLHRLHELAEEGFIGQVAPRHIGLMGFIPQPKALVEETAPQVARLLVEDGVDVVLLTPG